MSIAYFDCFSGAGGDMIVASLLAAGADEDCLRKAFSSMGVDGYDVSIESVTKQGFAATRFHVALTKQESQPHRHLKDVVAIIERGDLSDVVREQAVQVFTRLAEAEAKVHGTSVQKVHFHEVGAVDAILDIVGACVALETLGVDEVICSTVTTGSGVVKCAHGVMPVPAPATAELLTGVPIVGSNEPGELVTPTAAALLTTLAGSFGPVPALTISSLGYGAGTRDGESRPNVLRVLIGERTTEGGTDEITVLETNVDDASPEVVGYCMDRLLAMGALDAYAMPIHMKKSRTGVLLAVLCEHADVAAMERVLFEETTTFGVRRHRVSRQKLERTSHEVATEFGKVRVKVGSGHGALTASPEFDDCKKAAEQHGVSLRTVMASANAAWAAMAKKAAGGPDGGSNARCPK